MALYKGKEVQILREAVKSDPNWGTWDNLLVILTPEGQETVRIGELTMTQEETDIIFKRKSDSLRAQLDSSISRQPKLDKVLKEQTDAIVLRDEEQKKAYVDKYAITDHKYDNRSHNLTDKQVADEKAYQAKKTAGTLTPKEIADHDKMVADQKAVTDKAAADKKAAEQVRLNHPVTPTPQPNKPLYRSL